MCKTVEDVSKFDECVQTGRSSPRELQIPAISSVQVYGRDEVLGKSGRWYVVRRSLCTTSARPRKLRISEKCSGAAEGVTATRPQAAEGIRNIYSLCISAFCSSSNFHLLLI